MKVQIYSRKAIEELLQGDFPKNTAGISFYDPPSKRTGEVFKPVDYKGKAERVFTVPIYDIDIEILEDYGLTFETYFPEVGSLAEYIQQAYKDGLDIICQCEYGQSRSAACAAAILQYYYNDGISIFADYRYYPNQLVYNKIKNALDKGEQKMNAVIYVRHADKTEVDKQLNCCRQYAKDNGISVVSEYIENTNNRDMEELSKIVEESKSGTFNAVIVYRLDRIGRNRLKASETVYTLKQNGVTVISTLENVGSVLDEPLQSLMCQLFNMQKEEETL